MKKNKQKISYISGCTYYFPGLKYAEKLSKMEDKLLDKLYWKRWNQILNKNHKFRWTEENTEWRWMKLSDLRQIIFISKSKLNLPEFQVFANFFELQICVIHFLGIFVWSNFFLKFFIFWMNAIIFSLKVFYNIFIW